MKKFMTVLSALAITAIIALPAYAGDKAEKKASAQQFTGLVTAVDSEKGTLTVDKKGETKTFTCNTETTVDLGKKEAGKLADIKQGDKVKIKYTMKGESAVAQKILVNPSTEKKDKPAKKEAPAAQ